MSARRRVRRPAGSRSGTGVPRRKAPGHDAAASGQRKAPPRAVAQATASKDSAPDPGGPKCAVPKKAGPARVAERAAPRGPAVPRPVSARKWLRQLASHVPVAILGEDPEGVHQVRVSAGRLGVWLEMGGWSVLRDDLRALRRSAAAVRDADVLLDRDPPEAFAMRLRERREHGRAAMIPHLQGAHARALRQALGLLPAIPRETAIDSLPAFRDRVLRRGDALVAEESPPDEMFHDLRRAVRKLRYALEWLGGDSSPVKPLQQTFGDLNDLAVELRTLEETGAALELAAHAETLRAQLATAKALALGTWAAARPGVERIGAS